MQGVSDSPFGLEARNVRKNADSGGRPCLLADGWHCDYGTLLVWCHRRQAQALVERSRAALADGVVETDEMFLSAGEKGELHADRSDPPRRRANKREGRGTLHNDYAPIVGMVGGRRGRSAWQW